MLTNRIPSDTEATPEAGIAPKHGFFTNIARVTAFGLLAYAAATAFWGGSNISSGVWPEESFITLGLAVAIIVASGLLLGVLSDISRKLS